MRKVEWWTSYKAFHVPPNQGASAEVELKRGGTVKVTTDASFNDKGSSLLDIDKAESSWMTVSSLLLWKRSVNVMRVQSFVQHNLQCLCD